MNFTSFSTLDQVHASGFSVYISDVYVDRSDTLLLRLQHLVWLHLRLLMSHLHAIHVITGGSHNLAAERSSIFVKPRFICTIHYPWQLTAR